MARTVRVGEFQRMQRQSAGPSHVGLAESQALGDADQALGDADQAGHDVASRDPLTGDIVDAPPAPLSVPEQLAALEIHATAGSAYADIVKRLKTRVGLLGIPAFDEEIAAEARRRCGMLPEPTVEDAIAAAEGLPLLADAPDEVIASLGQDDPAGDGPVGRRGRYAFTDQDYENRLEDERRQAYFATEQADTAAVEPKPDDQAAQILAEKHGRGLHAGLVIGGCPTCEAHVELKPDDQAEPVPDAMTRLVAREMPLLDVGASCTAEMSLHMITERVRDAVVATEWGKLATDAEIVAEAERIWASFNDNRRGPREVTVNADGTVRNWRRPDRTPDRGPDVGTTHHTIGEEPRFSGAGAEDAQQQGLFLVPNDSDFRGKLYRDAPELANLAERLIGEHGFLEGLINCEIRYYWRRKTGVSKGRVKIGYCKRASDLLGHFSGADFIIWLSATPARDGKFTDRQIEAAIFHQLLHIETDDEGNFISARHDFEGFAAEITHYGVWTSDLKTLVPAVTAAQQMGLFDVDDDEGIEDEDDEEGEAAEQAYFDAAGDEMERDIAAGAGVLIHDDGTPLTDDEIAEQERHELADDDLAADEDDDPLADHDL